MSTSIVLHGGESVELGGEVAGGRLTISDIRLGEWLGYDRPRKVRELIDRHLDDLPGISPCPTLGRGLNAGDSPGFTSTVEYELPIVDAYALVMHSEAPNRAAVLERLRAILKRSYELAAAPALPNDALALLAARLDRIESALLSGRRGPRKALAPGQGTLFTTSVQETALDPIEGAVRAYLAGLGGGDEVSINSVAFCALALNPREVDRTAASQIGVVLARAGWVRSQRPKIEGRRVWLYRRAAQGEA